ncbi:MAG: type II 3-dehydroquinate dehydratase [Chloroflexi bacterium]|nr:type II 3-dehydroquinate dehydratase [Chloroflexota bacterium]MCH7952385.1 type II 3-dehydroquinate dehydratase [Chloroflexota bacterium]MCI0783746.1 type II 3-dehydroquinate dehydratase [Chloroflexota bacterium]MCI0813810.1 type II 3-dehydroquinate dehydratase [Chloroflexota bacterium]MCI0817015.1 type II 3-dehydroquinate dehydratase [Chloroflexota bacterium]
MRILLINGPNLNLLGTRNPEVYGTTTLQDIVDRVTQRGEQLGAEIVAFQSNSEGAIIDFIQANAPGADGILINAGAFTHYSLAIRDAFEAVETPFVEVHISNVHAREEFRHHSVLADIAVAQVAGLGWRGYIAALDSLVGILKERQ